MSKRSKLDEISRLKEEELEHELEILAEKGKTVATNVMYIAGGLAVSYLVYKVFFATKKKVKNKNKAKKLTNSLMPSGDEEVFEEDSNSWFSDVTQTLAKEAAIILLSIAKEKIHAYLTKNDDTA